MLINDYSALKIWENEQRENAIKLSRTIYGLRKRKAPTQIGIWTLLAIKLTGLMK